MWSIVITVGIYNYGQAGEIIFRSKNSSSLHSIFCIPNSKTITKKVLLGTSHTELNYELPIPRPHRLQKKSKHNITHNARNVTSIG